MLPSSTQLQNRSFNVVERTRTSTKCQKLKNARSKRAKILFFIVKYANLWGFSCRRRRGCLSSLLTQPRRRRQQERHKFTYLSTKNNSFSRSAREFFLFLHFADILVLSTTSYGQFGSCVAYVMTNVQFCLVISKALVPIYFQDS